MRLKCGRCGRTLTNPKSIRLGFGPTCLYREIKQHSEIKKSTLTPIRIPPLFEMKKEETV